MGTFPEFKWAEDDSLPNKRCLIKEQEAGEVNPAEHTWSILSLYFESRAFEFSFIPSNELLHGLDKRLFLPAQKNSVVKNVSSLQSALLYWCFLVI